MKVQLLLLITLLLNNTGCSIEQEPIHFGKDVCSYCSMTIIDAGHASEIITVKGKVYKFDSIECMIRGLNHQDDEIAEILVMDFSNPGNFINAKTAVFIISQDIASPMGANLSAFKSEQAIAQKKVNGTTYNWTMIQQHIN